MALKIARKRAFGKRNVIFEKRFQVSNGSIKKQAELILHKIKAIITRYLGHLLSLECKIAIK